MSAPVGKTAVEGDIKVAPLSASILKNSPDAEDFPVAQGTAIVVASPSSANTITTIDLPIGSAAFQFTGSPVRLGETLDKDVILPAGVDSSWYVHSIQIFPDLEVSHLRNADTANKILKSNAHLGRRLGVSRQIPTLHDNELCHYTHTLPTPANLDALQLKVDGFPPRVVTVGDKSPLAGKVHPRQVVHEVRIPGKAAVSAKTPGFTGYRVQQDLNKNSDVTGIRFTVKDELRVIKKEKGSSEAFDDCVIL